MTRLKDEEPADNETPLEDEMPVEPVEDKTPLLETAPCKICSCTDFESSSSDDKVCRCGHKDTDHKDVIWPGA